LGIANYKQTDQLGWR